MAESTLAELGIDLGAVEEALERNYTFPARWYSDPRVYEFELERIFTRSWQLAVPLHKVERPGSFALARVAHIPILVVRGGDGELRGFVNVCRHRAYPVAAEDGCRKTLQCAYHGWTYELDGRLRRAPRSEREADFDPAELSLVPVSVDTWCGYVWVNPDPEAPAFREVHPDAEPLALERGLDFSAYRYYGSYEYEIEANWKVWVENATECYHCPTVHKRSFSDAFDVDVDVYEYRNVGRILGQFTRYNPRAKVFPVDGERTPNDFRFIYVWPTSFFAMDDFAAFPGIIVPTGPESCQFVAEMYVHPDLDEEAMRDWVEMYNQTLTEDANAVRVQQPGLRSRMVPHGRLMPGSESSISSFHRMVFDAFATELA